MDFKKIAVIGMGYVGLPLALNFARKFKVVGYDTDKMRIGLLKRGESYFRHISDNNIGSMVLKGDLIPTDNIKDIASCDVVIICVPTPLKTDKATPDLDNLKMVCNNAVVTCTTWDPKQTKLIVIESTVYPGATREIISKINADVPLPEQGKHCKWLAGFSPERIDPGNPIPLYKIAKIVSGINDESRDAVAELYRECFENVIVAKNLEEAETAKMLENSFRAVNIALVNEFKHFCMNTNIDIWEVIELAATKPYGFMKFKPGPGVGGHCIPVDPMYQLHAAASADIAMPTLMAAMVSNKATPMRIAQQVAYAVKVDDKPKCVLLIGVAYKRDIDDARESPAQDIYLGLRQNGIEVIYHDPLIDPWEFKFDDNKIGYRLVSVSLGDGLNACDAAIIITDHSEIDLTKIAMSKKIVFDARNAMSGMVISMKTDIVFI